MTSLARAVEILIQGGLVIYPTDTAFGIGCRIDNRSAVDRLFSIRERPRSQATPVLINSLEMAQAYFTSVTPQMSQLMKMYWPGALTIVGSTDKALVYDPVRGGGETVGLRMPNHETPLGLITGVGVPILGPSANFHGRKTPYHFEDIDPELIKLVDVVIPGTCSIGAVSTVVDCTVKPPQIIRQGAVKLAQLIV